MEGKAESLSQAGLPGKLKLLQVKLVEDAMLSSTPPWGPAVQSWGPPRRMASPKCSSSCRCAGFWSKLEAAFFKVGKASSVSSVLKAVGLSWANSVVKLVVVAKLAS